MVPMESLASPGPSEREPQPQAPGQDPHAAMSDQCVETSSLHSDPEDPPLLCSSPPLQDTETPPPASFTPPAGAQLALVGPEGSATQPPTEPQVQYQAPHQLQVPQALFAQKPVSQPLPKVQVSAAPPQSSVSSCLSPLNISVSVPQQQPDPTAAGVSTGGDDDSAVQQHTQNSESQLLLVTLTCISLHQHRHHRPHCDSFQSQQLPWSWRVKCLLLTSIRPLRQPRASRLTGPRLPESVAPPRRASRLGPRSERDPVAPRPVQ